MPGVSKFTDEQLQDLLKNGVPQAQIAKLLRVSPMAISKRVKLLEVKSHAKAPVHAQHAVSSMWDTRQAAQENYERALSILENECETPSDKIRAVGEIRQHLTFAMQVLETLYTVQETQAFMEEVLAVIEEIDCDARNRILKRLTEKRTLRAAFLPH